MITREDYEVWAKSIQYFDKDLGSWDGTHYVHYLTEIAWQSWQACDELNKARIAELEERLNEACEYRDTLEELVDVDDELNKATIAELEDKLSLKTRLVEAMDVYGGYSKLEGNIAKLELENRTLREALQEAKQEPVAWASESDITCVVSEKVKTGWNHKSDFNIPLYLHPTSAQVP